MADRPQKKTRKSKSSTPWILLAITGLGAFAFVGSVGVVAWMVRKGDVADVRDGSFLEVELSGPLPDAPVQGGVYLDPSDFPLLVTEYAEAIRSAADDARIEGLYLEIGSMQAGLGSLWEIRSAVEDFRASGKPCVAYSEGWTTGGYYLASACDQLVLPPGGINLVNGISASVAYYAGAFEKLGVQAEFEHVGDFKSAVEPYERTGPSEAASEAMNHVLDGIWTQMVGDIARGRGVTPEQVQAWVDAPVLAPGAALERGMIDAVAFPDQVRARLHEVGDEGWADRVAEPLTEEEREDSPTTFTKIAEYQKGVRNRHRSATRYVAVVHAEGPIVSGEAEGGLFAESVIADRSFAKLMKRAREDDAVKAVVLRVDSPGGSGLASDLMLREIRRTQEAGKPVVVSMGDLAASGGYFISAQADHIVAEPITITGSIGVLGGKLNFSGTMEKLGVNQHTYERGEEADLFSSMSSFSDAGREAFRGYLSEFYTLFLDRVAEGRDMTRDEVHAVAQGRIWTGAQAVELGLVDELGGLDVAVERAAEKAGLEGYGVRRLPQPKGLVELLLEDLQKKGDATALVKVDVDLPGGADEALRDVLLLERIFADGVATVLPGGLEIR